MPEANVSEPDMLIAPLPANVPVKPEKLILPQPVLPVAIVTVVLPDSESKKQLSELVGIACPPAPPELDAHFVPAVPSQLAVPPTQYLLAA